TCTNRHSFPTRRSSDLTSMAQVLEKTDNEDAEKLFSAGMSKVYLLLSNDLDLAEALEENRGEFFTVLVSSDFGDEDLAQQVTTRSEEHTSELKSRENLV